MIKGICRLCKKYKDLSFEHIPPSVAFNKLTKYRSVPYIEYMEQSHKPNYKPSGKLHQGGVGENCLCVTCNSFLGTNYVNDYYKVALNAKAIVQKYSFKVVQFEVDDFSPLRFLKQVLSMFICINKPEFTDNNPELLDFVKDSRSNVLPEKYKVYMYVNGGGQIKKLPWVFHNKFGLVCEIAFQPLGFVLSIDTNSGFENLSAFDNLAEITKIKDLDCNLIGSASFTVFNLITNSQNPLDFRSEEEIQETIKANLKLLSDAEFEDSSQNPPKN